MSADLRITYEWDQPDGVFVFEVAGYVDEYDPGDWTTAPCGGGAEVVEATIVLVYDEDKRFAADMSKEEKEQIEARFWAAICRNEDGLSEILEERLIAGAEAEKPSAVDWLRY